MCSTRPRGPDAHFATNERWKLGLCAKEAYCLGFFLLMQTGGGRRGMPPFWENFELMV
jgi:hypothetical protein